MRVTSWGPRLTSPADHMTPADWTWGPETHQSSRPHDPPAQTTCHISLPAKVYLHIYCGDQAPDFVITAARARRLYLEGGAS